MQKIVYVLFAILYCCSMFAGEKQPAEALVRQAEQQEGPQPDKQDLPDYCTRN